MGIWTRKPQRCPEAAEDEEGTIDLGEVSLFDLMGALAGARPLRPGASAAAPAPAGEPFRCAGSSTGCSPALEPGRPFDLLEDLRTPLLPRRGDLRRSSPCSSWRGSTLVRIHQTEAATILALPHHARAGRRTIWRRSGMTRAQRDRSGPRGDPVRLRRAGARGRGCWTLFDEAERAEAAEALEAVLRALPPTAKAGASCSRRWRAACASSPRPEYHP